MTTAGSPNYQLLIIDDEASFAQELAEELSESLADIGFISCETETSFEAGERLLSERDFDLVVLDVKDASEGVPGIDMGERGRELYERIRKHRWIPVVFWTGVPNQVEELQLPPLVQVVRKNAISEVAEAVRLGLESGVPALTRRIEEMVDQEIRSFLRDVVAPKWSEMAEADQQEIGPVLVNRLAAWLKERGVAVLGGETVASATVVEEMPFSAARVYLYPRVSEHVTTGDLLRDGDGGWWLVLTPACDLYRTPSYVVTDRPRKPKADYVRVARADLSVESPTVARWIAGEGSKDAAKSVFKVGNYRYMPLPKYLSVPDLVVDFENVRSVRPQEADTWTAVATLDSPFVEAALAAHSRAVGRIGTPDIPMEVMWRAVQQHGTPTSGAN